MYSSIYYSPITFMVAFCGSGSIRLPSRQKTFVPLRFAAAVTVAVDVMEVPDITSVTAN